MITVIRGITLIDGSGADPLHNAALAFSQERILEVGRASQVSVPREAYVIEADGLFLLPGLIDTHVHLVYSGLNLLEEIRTPPSLSLLRVVPHAKATLDAGVTTARDAGGTPAGVKLAIERGFFPGPRLQVAISLLSQTGGHADSHLPCGVQIPLPSSDIPHTVVDGCDEVRKAARQILQAGADWIKLCATGGVLSKDDHPSQCQFTVEELTTAVYEATAHGKRVMAHAQATQGIKNAIRAGVTSVEHGVWLDDEAIEIMVRNDVWLVPTLVASREVIERAEKVPGSMPEWAVTKAKQVTTDHMNSFRQAVAAGVRVAMGTDSGVGEHGRNARELGLMVEGGLTPMQALVAATSDAARLLYPNNPPVGILQPGKSADLLLVTRDPLRDVCVLENQTDIKLIVRNGAIYKSTL